jgi:hypothetical protein
MNDTGAAGANDGDDWMPDLDGAPNTAGDDGADDGLFPASHALLPFIPEHIFPNPPALTARLRVADHTGPRYAGGATLSLRGWADWNSDGDFDDSAEQIFDTSTAPAGWPGDSLDLAVDYEATDDHIRGNPLRIRTRLYGPGEAAGGPDSSQAFGEVEDHEVLNFVEDCDTDHHADGSVFATYGSLWSVVPDPAVPGPDWPSSTPANQLGGRRLGVTTFPCTPSTGTLSEAVFPESTAPPLDLRELTTARLRIWIAHAVCGCDPAAADRCRLAIRRYDMPGGPYTEFLIKSFPEGNPPGFTCVLPDPSGWYVERIEADLSAHVGSYLRAVVYHDVSDYTADWLLVDDVKVWGHDGRPPEAVSLAGSGLDDQGRASLSWSHPNDNDPPVAGPEASDGAAFHEIRIGAVSIPWKRSWRLTPRDFADAGSSYPVPGDDGGSASAGFLAPTTFPDLRVAIRTEDEVARNALGAWGVLAAAPVFDVSVSGPSAPFTAAPGDTVRFAFAVTNSSTSLDAVGLVLTDSREPDWILCPERWTHLLDGWETAIDSVRVAVPSGAADGDTCRVVLNATSLSDSSKTVAEEAIVIVDAPVACLHIADHDAGNVRFSVTDLGNLGYLDSDQTSGSGFVYPRTGGVNRLFMGGFWGGTDTGYVLNREDTDDPVADWVPLDCLLLCSGMAADEEGYGVYSDLGNPAPRGLRIVQKSYAWASPPDDDYVILSFEATNAGAEVMDELWLGPFFDWDLDETGGFDLNLGGIDSTRSLMFMWRDGGDGTRVGVKALSHLPAPQMSFIHNPTYIYPFTYLRDADRFHFLSGDAPGYTVHATPSRADWSMVMGVGPFQLLPGDTVSVGFAVAAGSSLADLQANADAAQSKWVSLFGSVAAAPPPEEAVRISELRPAHPNPFSRSAAIYFDLAAPVAVKLDIYDIGGRWIARLADGIRPAGRHVAAWEGRTSAGRQAPAGIYMARLQAAGEVRTRKLILRR